MARYIDADEINPCEEDFETHQDFLKALDLIVEAPTADVVEVKHGKWIEENHKSYLVHPVKYDDNGEPILQDYTSYKCSLCGRVEAHKEPYCNCGAKMDGAE